MKKVIGLIFIVVVLVSGFILFKAIKPTVKSELSCDDCNVIVISLSNLRKNNMSFYNKSLNTTPNIDHFFSSSLYFTHAIAPASLTYTDAASFFYSVQPVKHKFMNRPDRFKTKKILETFKSLPKVLSENGYETAAFVSDEDYTYENGLGDQFGFYFDKKLYEENGIEFKPWQYNIGTKDLVAPVTEWLKKNHQSKFFLFFQAYDMHCPYLPSEKFKQKFSSIHNAKINFDSCFMTLDKIKSVIKNNKKYFELYDWKSFLEKDLKDPILLEQSDLVYLENMYNAELASADENLKLLFQTIDELSLDKKTIIIFMSEHGDYLGENGYYMKAAVTADGNLHNANLNYPLLIKLPKIKNAFKQDQIVQTIDLAPTILSLLNIDPPNKMQGKSLANVLLKNDEVNDFAFTSTSRKRNFIDKGVFVTESVQNKTWKLDYFKHLNNDGSVIEKKVKLVDLINDPKEEINLKDSNKEMLNMLIKKLEEKRSFYEK